MLKLQEKGSAAINYTYTPTSAVQIEEIRLHLSAAGGAAEAFTATIDDKAGAEYDVPIKTVVDMTSIIDIVYQPTGMPHKLIPGDKLVIAFANTNTRGWGLTIIASNI